MSSPRRRTLLLVRHGETDWNAQSRWQGQRDTPLSDTGRAQAVRLAARLGSLWERGVLPLPDRVLVSDLSRARETEQLLRDNQPHALPPAESTPLLRERGFGSWEGLTTPEAQARFGAHYERPHDGESYASVWQRVQQVLEIVWHSTAEDSTALLVGHGGSLRALLTFAVGLPADDVRRFVLDNTSLSIIALEGTTLTPGRLLRVNDTAHLETP